MFGHDDHKKDEDRHDDNVSAPTDEQTVDPDNQPSGHTDWQHPGTPLKDDSQTDDFTSESTSTPAGSAGLSNDRTSGTTTSNTPASSGFNSPAPAHGNDALLDIKQEALGKLSPLIGHLDQTPDEKFRTLMMMIQASDDQGLVQQAYETALKIDDEKTRAQALLDIVNEINYFTQNLKSK